MDASFRKYWHNDQAEPQFLLEGGGRADAVRAVAAICGAICYHLLLIVFVFFAPSTRGAHRDLHAALLDLRRATPLVAPRVDTLTQKAPNTRAPAAEVNLEGLLPRPALEPTPPAPAPRFVEPPKVDAPKTDLAQIQAPLPAAAAAPPRIEPQEKPKLAFEPVAGPRTAPEGKGAGAPQVERPKTTVEDAARAYLRSGARGGLIVGDVTDLPSISEGMRQVPTPGRNLGALELLSDPQGVDFKPYLIQILAAVKRNWLAVLPESARYGRRGRVALQFAINTAGKVTKLVIANGSGADALDRAAVAGVSASDPFPPLPNEFRGSEIRVQFVFSYNMPGR